MKKYKCVQEFVIEIYDEYCMQTSEYQVIKDGTIWERDDEENRIGGEVHLDRNDGLEWIEISFETLRRRFE